MSVSRRRKSRRKDDTAAGPGPDLDRFPPPAVVVLADDLLAVPSHARCAVISFAAELTGLIAGSLVAEGIAGGGWRRCSRRCRRWRSSRGGRRRNRDHRGRRRGSRRRRWRGSRRRTGRRRHNARRRHRRRGRSATTPCGKHGRKTPVPRASGRSRIASIASRHVVLLGAMPGSRPSTSSRNSITPTRISSAPSSPDDQARTHKQPGEDGARYRALRAATDMLSRPAQPPIAIVTRRPALTLVPGLNGIICTRHIGLPAVWPGSQYKLVRR